MTQTPDFNKSIGYDFNDNYPVSGYGITIETIQSWLNDNNLNPNATGYERGANKSLEDATTHDVAAYLETFNPHTHILYLTIPKNMVDILMIFAMLPGDKRTVIPSKSEVRNEIKDAINQLWDVPKKYQASLTTFLATYVSYINFCDYYD